MIKTLTQSLRQNKKGSIITIFLSILEVAFEILIPLCMAELIDQGIDLGQMRAVWKFGIALLIFALLQLVTGIYRLKNIGRICRKSAAGYVRQCADLCLFQY